MGIQRCPRQPLEPVTAAPLSPAAAGRFRRTDHENPIGASTGWTWHGYRTSSVDIEAADRERLRQNPLGRRRLIHAEDQARLGLLILRRGDWQGRRILPESWIAENSLRPCTLNPNYGLLWWLNTGCTDVTKSAPEASFFASGAGGNLNLGRSGERSGGGDAVEMDPASVDGFIQDW